MKKFRVLSVIFALLLALGIFAACGEEKDPGGPSDPETPNTGDEEEELPEYDGNGNRYVDLVTVTDTGTTYNGINAYIDGYADLPAFEDVHSSTAFEFGDRDPADVLGFVHAGGQYNFTEQPYLTEGANLIARDIGSHVIKLFLGSDIADQYSFNETWGSHDSLADLVQEDEIDAVFSRADLNTYIIVTYEMDRLQWDSTAAVSQSELERVQKEFSDLTTHLIRAYNDTGKTFVLQNWEGDNELREALAKTTDETTEQTIIDNYIAYNNARQAGITAAREALFATDDYANINVYGALEINYISYDAPEKKLVDYVVPHSDADLFSFSDWSTSNANLAEDLAYYLSKINENEDRQGENAATMNDIYLGEYGRKESTAVEENQFSYAVETAKIAVNAGVRWVCYWTLMCNERTEASTSRPVNSDMEGFWLIKPDGTITKTFWYFKGLLEDKNFLAGDGVSGEVEKPALVLRLPAEQAEAIPFPENESDILFYDDFDDVDLDGNPALELNEKWEDYSDGLQYDHVRAADQPKLSRYFEKYGLTPEIGFTVVQKKENNPEEEYIQYEVVRASADAEGKFLIQGFLYDPTPKSILRVDGTTNGTAWETLESVYVMDKAGEYGYLYVTTVVPVGYTSVRVVFTNTKAGNSWDPLVCRVLFVK